ncbi:MAG: leucine-rich repeat protein, partial [Ruminococcus sp.]|nr:leucine-rich repeat protein [Ruminococcus sp.]
DAFYGCDDLTIKGVRNSAAHQYAVKNEIPFEEYFSWTFDETTGVLTVNDNTDIPDFNNGAEAPWNTLPVKEVVIGQNITSIGTHAFEGMTELKKVTVPDSVTDIGAKAFYGCEKLKSVYIPKSVTVIGEKALGYYVGEYYNNDLDFGTKEMTVDGFCIIGIQNSETDRYADENGIGFKPLMTGDLNCDGKVNGADTGLFNRYFSGWDGYADKIVNMTCADVNGDGVIRGNDAGLLNRYVSGWTGYDSYIIPVK